MSFAPGESAEQKVQYSNRGLACLALAPGVRYKPAPKAVNFSLFLNGQFGQFRLSPSWGGGFPLLLISGRW
jgi:hypothetical protein